MTENITQPPLKPMRQVMEEVIREAATVTPYGKARYQMLKSGKISSSSLASALQIYDLRRPDDFPKGELLDRLIELLGLQDIDWPPSQINREIVMEEKIKNELERRLRKLGYVLSLIHLPGISYLLIPFQVPVLCKTRREWPLLPLHCSSSRETPSNSSGRSPNPIFAPRDLTARAHG